VRSSALPCPTLLCRALPCSALRGSVLLCTVLSHLENSPVLQEHSYCTLCAKATGLSCSPMGCNALVLCCAQSLLLFTLAQQKPFGPCWFFAQNTKCCMICLATMRAGLVSVLLGRILMVVCFLLGCILVLAHFLLGCILVLVCPLLGCIVDAGLQHG